MPSSPTKKTATPVSWFNWLLYSLVTIMILVGAGLFFILNYGYVSGEELNPKTFERRSFEFRKLPFTEIQITPVTYTTISDSYFDYITTHKVLPISGKTTWQVVYSRVGPQYITGDAKILTDLMDVAAITDETFWLNWSKKHPEKAKVLWPLVSEVAVNEAYLIVSDFLDFVAQLDPKTDSQFDAKLESKLASLYEELADDLRDMGDHNAAVRIYKAALSHNADLDSIKENIVKSQQILDDTQAAAAADKN